MPLFLWAHIELLQLLAIFSFFNHFSSIPTLQAHVFQAYILQAFALQLSILQEDTSYRYKSHTYHQSAASKPIEAPNSTPHNLQSLYPNVEQHHQTCRHPGQHRQQSQCSLSIDVHHSWCS
jgi:uncharacterized protein (DUF608 family)